MKQHAAALILQRYGRGHLVSKHYIRQRGDIAIMATLKSFRDMKTMIGIQLSNLLRFYWKVYKRKKDKKKKKKKGKGKKGKGKKLAGSKTMSLTMGSPSRSNSLATPVKSGAKAGTTGSAAKSGAKIDKQASFSKAKVTAQDHEGTLDLTSGDNENAFSYSAQEMMRRETMQPENGMEQIAEGDGEEGNEDGEGDGEGSPDIKEENEEDEDDKTKSNEAVLPTTDLNQSQAQSNKELFKLHEVSILDLDKEGSLLNDVDSMDEKATR